MRHDIKEWESAYPSHIVMPVKKIKRFKDPVKNQKALLLVKLEKRNPLIFKMQELSTTNILISSYSL